MVTLSTEVLVIGGGATGAGVAWDAALRGFDVVLVDRARPGRGHQRPLPRPAALRRALRGQGPARRRGVRRREPRSCGGSPPTASRTPAACSSPRRATTPPTRDEFAQGCRDDRRRLRGDRAGRGAAPRAAAQPARSRGRSACPTATSTCGRLVWALAAGRQQHGGAGPALPRGRRAPSRGRRGHRRAGARRAHRRGARRRGARHASTRRAPGPGRSPTWPGSRASACSPAAGS